MWDFASITLGCAKRSLFYFILASFHLCQTTYPDVPGVVCQFDIVGKTETKGSYSNMVPICIHLEGYIPPLHGNTTAWKGWAEKGSAALDRYPYTQIAQSL